MNAKRNFLNGSVCPVMAAITLILGFDSALAAPVCDDNGGLSPWVCVDKLGDDAQHLFDFIRDFTDPANPVITLLTGNLGWRVWSQNAFNFPTAANLGGVNIDPSLDSDNFVVTISNPNGQPGAKDFGGALLIDTDPESEWIGYSSLPQVVVREDLTGDITMRQSGGNGGVLDLAVGTQGRGHIEAGVTVTADKLSNLSVNGDLRGAINIVDMLPGAELRIEKRLTSTGSITISENAERVLLDGNVAGTVSIGTIVDGGALKVGAFSSGAEREVITPADLTGTVFVGENSGYVQVGGDLFGSITVDNITGTDGALLIFGTTQENGIVTIGDMTTVGFNVALFCNLGCPGDPPDDCCEFKGKLILENGIPQSNFVVSFHGPIRDELGHDAIDFRGKDLVGTLEFNGGDGRVVNIGEIRPSGVLNVADAINEIDFTGVIEVATLAGSIQTHSPVKLGGTISISGDVTSTGHISPGALLDAIIHVGGDMDGSISGGAGPLLEILVGGLINGDISIGGEFTGNICDANMPAGGPLPSNIGLGSIGTGAALCDFGIECQCEGGISTCVSDVECIDFDPNNDPDDCTANLCHWNRCWNPQILSQTCDVAAPVAAERPYHTAANNRWLTFDPNNLANVALEVKLIAGPGTLGVLGWVGEPDVNGVSRIVDTAYFATAWPAVVLLGDCGIVPDALYWIRATTGGFSLKILSISTIAEPAAPNSWGDVVGPVDPGGRWTAPDGVTDQLDVDALVLGFEGCWNGADVTWLDVEGEVPNFLVNFNDVLEVILAAGGNPYPFSDPDGCCLENTTEGSGGSPGPQMSTNVTLRLDTNLIAAGGLLQVDVFIDAATDLAAYEVSLEVTGGDGGRVVLESLTIDTQRRDYVFAGAAVREGLDRIGARLGAATSDGRGMNVRGSSYLGTFSFRASSDASGVFAISCAAGESTFLTDSTMNDIAVSMGPNRLIHVVAE